MRVGVCKVIKINGSPGTAGRRDVEDQGCRLSRWAGRQGSESRATANGHMDGEDQLRGTHFKRDRLWRRVDQGSRGDCG